MSKATWQDYWVAAEQLEAWGAGGVGGLREVYHRGAIRTLNQWVYAQTGQTLAQLEAPPNDRESAPVTLGDIFSVAPGPRRATLKMSGQADAYKRRSE